jgi:hypothetical protein
LCPNGPINDEPMSEALIVVRPADGFAFVTANVADDWFAGTVTVAGTVAAAGLLLCRLTTTPLATAGRGAI